MSEATRDDLALLERRLAEVEAARADAVAALARIQARHDGEACVGMPIAQHLVWRTNTRRSTVNRLQTVAEAAAVMPVLAAALGSGQISFDQACAVAYASRSVSSVDRMDLNDALTATPNWTRWEPDSLEWECGRVLDDLRPVELEEREASSADREYLHRQPSLDGQRLRFWGQYEGLNAALFDAAVTAAAPPPPASAPATVMSEPASDAVVVGVADEGQPVLGGPDSPSRAGQLAQGLLRIISDWQHGSCGDVDDVGLGAAAAPRSAATVHVLVPEDGDGRGEVWTHTKGLRPRLSAAAVRRLQQDPDSRTVTVRTRQGAPTSIDGRAGHAVDDPDRLSKDSTHTLARIRAGRCRAPGCDNPALWTERHHLHHRARGGSDRISNLVSLCRRCHLQLIHAHDWVGEVDADGRLAWRRDGTTIVTEPRHRRRLRRPPPRSDPDVPF